MSAVSYSLEHVDGMIDALEAKIESGSVKQTMLDALQKWLDAVDSVNREHPNFAHYYPRMLELQALIYGEGNQEDKALEFVKEAVRQTGSVSGLYSNLIRQYIISHAPKRQAQAAQTAQPAPALADEEAGDDMGFSDVPMRGGTHAKSRFRKLKIAFVVVFGLTAIGAAVLRFVPAAGALPSLLSKHAEITNAKQVFDRLTAEYQSCSSSLASERNSVDTYDSSAVDNYNQATQHCQTILAQENQAADHYNKLVGLQ